MLIGTFQKLNLYTDGRPDVDASFIEGMSQHIQERIIRKNLGLIKQYTWGSRIGEPICFFEIKVEDYREDLMSYEINIECRVDFILDYPLKNGIELLKDIITKAFMDNGGFSIELSDDSFFYYTGN